MFVLLKHVFEQFKLKSLCHFYDKLNYFAIKILINSLNDLCVDYKSA